MANRSNKWGLSAAGALILVGCGGSPGESVDEEECDPGIENCTGEAAGGANSAGGGLATGGADSDEGMETGGQATDAGGSPPVFGTPAGGSTTGGASAGGQAAGGSMTGGDTGTGGESPAGGSGGVVQSEPVCDVDDPSEYVLNAGIGGGEGEPETSEHFAIFGAADVGDTLHFMEAAHQCFVQDWCWRTPGLSHRLEDGERSKMNILVKAISAGGVMQYDETAGLSYLEVNPNSIDSQHVVVHEFGHALTLTEYGWVYQGNTGLWWESIAQFVAESFSNSVHCEEARSAYGIASGPSSINLGAVIGNSHLTMCNNSNQYEAWPFFTYLTNNPDGYPGLGKMIVPELFRNHLGNNETPLHVLERLSAPVTVQTILGRYWARMAYVDIGSLEAQDRFESARGSLNYDNLDALGGGTFEVKPSRRPRYAGANIIPLSVTGDGTVSVQVTMVDNGPSDSRLTATLAVQSSGGVVRYIDLTDGEGEAMVSNDEEVSLVVANTPESLYMYDPSEFGATETSDPANTGVGYRVQITGAIP